MKNPYKQNTLEFKQWERGYSNAAWGAPPDNASAAQWRGYHDSHFNSLLENEYKRGFSAGLHAAKNEIINKFGL